MIPGPFDYHRPRSIDEAVALLARFGEDGRVLAGGHSLIPMMKLRLAVPAHLIDLRGIETLRGIALRRDTIEIGAMTTQAEVIAARDLAGACPILREAAELIADPQVRACGTIGGNVANGDPGNDMPAVMMSLDAAYALRGPGGERLVPAREFYQGTFVTALREGEVLTQVRIPTPTPGHGYAYQKLKRKVGDYATAAAAVVLSLDGAKCAKAAIALTNVAPTPIDAEDASAALEGTSVDEAAIAKSAALAVEGTDPVGDLRGPPEFRRHAAGVMVRRAIETALRRAKGA